MQEELMKKLIYIQVVYSVSMLVLFFVSHARSNDSYISVTAIALLAIFFTIIFLSTVSWMIVLGGGVLRLGWVVWLLPTQFGFMYGVMAGSQFGLSLEVVVPTVISFVSTATFFAPTLIRLVVRRRLEKEELELARELSRLVDLRYGFTTVPFDDEVQVKDKLEKIRFRLDEIKRRSR
jgi:hypothetical protein